ncbi:DUF3010 family protein [Catenovulum maritimum]|uniref:DUF3010 domain-containing protein n=1 Tax=Catenovulum maritimum TaxID=1513271 RepID=A0A0J8GXF4_9ALTE|nr:DUF3010 family protein [Catenovulum maritimum]KMT65423.1 hypothetical protein XM47_08690 [Catenovulum maritimum]
MRACGVEIKGSEAFICILELEDGLFDIPDCRAQKFIYRSSPDQNEIKDFQFEFQKLMEDYRVDVVVIKERPLKGKFAGSSVGFKMEAAIQLLDTVDVILQSNVTEKEYLKENPIPVDFKETGLKMFQQSAFSTAYSYLISR